MEGLLLLIGEFLFIPLVIFVLLGGELLVGALLSVVHLVEALANLCLGIAFRERSSVRNENPKPGPRRGRRWFRQAQRILLAGLAATLVALLLVNFAFLDRVVAWAARRVEARTGIAIEYATMEGNLLTGAFHFTDLRVHKPMGERATFDLRVADVAAQLSVWSMLRGQRTLDTLTISGIEGTYACLRRSEAESRRLRIAFTIGDAERPVSPRGGFFVRTLSITNGTILVEDQTGATPVNYPVHIASITAKPLRSHFLWFDLLFRSNLQLTVDGTEVVVENRTEGAMRHTAWSATDVNAPILASLVGGPFKLFTAGRLDVIARDAWQIREEPEINMHWALTLRDAQAAVPDGLPPILQIPSRILVDHVNAKTEPWDLSFSLRLQEGQFAGAASVDAQQIWAGATEAILKEVAGLSSEESTTVKDAARAGFDRFKEFLRKREEKAGEESAPAAEPEI